MKDVATIALEALGHVKVANERCTARYMNTPGHSGIFNPPVWCDLKAGHDGPHRHVSGHRFFVMDRLHLIELKPLPDICQKCRTVWPCPDAKKVIDALKDVTPCTCYPEHCTDPDHGKCWCDPTIEEGLIIHNRES